MCARGGVREREGVIEGNVIVVSIGGVAWARFHFFFCLHSISLRRGVLCATLDEMLIYRILFSVDKRNSETSLQSPAAKNFENCENHIKLRRFNAPIAPA